MPTLNLMERLRVETREVHRQLESLPYFQALFKDKLPLESYVGHLRALAVLHTVLERELAQARDPRIQSVWTEDLRRLPRIQADLHYFAPRQIRDVAAAAKAARVLADQVLRRSVDHPVSLLGQFYILEGSINGAQVLAPRFQLALSLEEGLGLTYLTWDPSVAESRWTAFRQRMNAVPLNASETDAILEAAIECFLGLRQMLEALFPCRSEHLTLTATSLNPEAGDHPVPEDPNELEAALLAATRCWEDFPYLEQRYGERGWRFTQSDSGWLVTLATHEQSVVHTQVEWIASILASRGMPRLLLQHHLELLHEELSARLPSCDEAYRKLLEAAHHLEERQRAAITDADAARIVGRFEQSIGPDWLARLPRIGPLLVGAVADRAHGIEQAVKSLEGWLTDPERFPPHWIEAVREALAESEQCLLPGATCAMTITARRQLQLRIGDSGI